LVGAQHERAHLGHEPGGRQARTSAPRTTQGPHELTLLDRIRRGEDEGSVEVLALEEELHSPD
jgi:hypothetical protein